MDDIRSGSINWTALGPARADQMEDIGSGHMLPFVSSSNSTFRAADAVDVDNWQSIGSPLVRPWPARNDSNEPNLMDFFATLSQRGQLAPELLYSSMPHDIVMPNCAATEGLPPNLHIGTHSTFESTCPSSLPSSPLPTPRSPSPQPALQSQRQKTSRGRRVAIRSPMPSASNQQTPPSSPEEDCEVIVEVPALKKARQQPSIGLGRFSKNIIESEQLSVLVASYHKHFGVYCKDKKRKVTQKVPNLVWRAIFQDFVAAFPNNAFQEESLKDRLRETLRELDTGTSNEPGNESAALQPDDVLEQIRSTDGHAARNVLKARAAVIDRRSPSLGSSDTSPASGGAEQGGVGNQGINPRGGSSTTQDKEKPKSKTEILAQQADGICMMAKSYANGATTREAFMSAKTDSAKAKVDSEKFKGVFFGAKAKSVMLNDLFRLRDVGVYSEEEFVIESRKIMDQFKSV